MSETAQQAIEPPAAAPTAAEEVRVLFDRANERQRANDMDGAIALYCDLLLRFPTVPDAYNNLAVILKTKKQLAVAIACLKRAVALAPNSGALYSNLGNMQWMALQYDDAMASFRRALALDPTRPEVYHNLGLLYFSLSNYQAAVECFDRALAHNASNKLVMWDRALALLAGGDFARGFAAYDVRFDLEDPSMGFDRKLRAVRGISLPLWQDEDLTGRTIYIYCEQGLGDTVQFARFLPLVARRGARILFDCPRELMRLFANFPGIADLRQEGSAMPQADFHLPMMSMPNRLGVTLATLPAQVPYLAAPTTGPVLARPTGTRVAAGIVWAGRPQHTNDHNRSLKLEELLPLAELPGLTLYSLQKGPRAEDINSIGARALIHDLGPVIHDFADTARLVMQLDVVITVDTSVAHIAGALGRPVFVLLPFAPDWRWMGTREDSPWYPTMRLFRQSTARDWPGVVQRVQERLSRSLGTKQ
jgi:tetratricopeptide (TPR) repeat protein